MGKIHAERMINKEVLQSILVNIWNMSKPFNVIDIGSNLFIIKFSGHYDKQRVMQGCPRLFNTNLLMLKQLDGCIPPSKMNFNSKVFWVHMNGMPIACMNEKFCIDIGNTIRQVKKCDVRLDGSGWGKVLRVLIGIDINQPITTGRTINVKGVSYWIPLTYENLPTLCFRCGKITHRPQLCEKGGSKLYDDIDQFGVWLRVEKGRKVTRGRLDGEGNDNPSPTPLVFQEGNQPPTAEMEAPGAEVGMGAMPSNSWKILLNLKADHVKS